MEKIFRKKGVISVIALLMLGIILVLGTYFLSFAVVESKISKSQEVAVQAYYLAEAGINQALWKMKYDHVTSDGDDPWADCFVTSTPSCSSCNDWSDEFTKNTSFLIPDSTLDVSITNASCAWGQIVATSTISLSGGKTAQRVVKTSVFKSIASPTANAAVISGGTSENIDINFSKIKITGNFFSNNNLSISLLSEVVVEDSSTTVETDGKTFAEGNLNLLMSTLTSYARCAKNTCDTMATCECEAQPDSFQECTVGACAPVQVAAPAVDFDSTGEYSFKMRAQADQDAGQCQILCNGGACTCSGSPCVGATKCVLTAAEFEDILWSVSNDGTVTLNNKVTYVQGAVDLKGGRYLVVNGVLVADDTIDIGETQCWTVKGHKDCGLSQITVNRLTDESASGMLTKKKINFGLYSSFIPTAITGVIYAGDEVRMVSLPQSFTVRGGIIGRKLSFTSVFSWFNFILDNEVILYGLGYKIDGMVIVPTFSPVILIDHWEESY